MGYTDDSLKDVQGRLPVPLVNEKGNYRRSVISKAAFMYQDGGGDFDLYAFTQGGTVKCLLFMNGSVVHLDPRTTYPAQPAATWELDLAEDMRMNANVELAIQLINTTQSELAVGEQVYGSTVTAGVYLFGQYAAMITQVRTEDLTGVTPFMRLTALSNSGVIAGEPSYSGTIDDVPQDVQQIILREQDYTQAMRDAGDKIVTTQGGVSIEWQIVGLFAEVVPV